MSKAKSRQQEKPRQPPKSLPLAPAAPRLTRRTEAVILAAILLLAAGLRLADREGAPPGLNQDEAANGWNAQCLLKTGKDQVGVPWPLFYFRALGSNYTPLNIYLLMPIQAVGGMSVWTTRAPAALGGILTVFLIWYVGRRLIGQAGGLLAAGMLAVNPWHLFTSRWGIEANLCPLLAIAPLAMLLASRLPPREAGALGAGPAPGPQIRGHDTQPPRLSIVSPNLLLAAVAGVLTGLCLYGYPAILLFLPLFLASVVAVTWRQWWGSLRTRRGAVAVALYALLAAGVFAPLAWQHAFHGAEIRKRAEGTWIWEFQQPPGRHYSLGDKAGPALSRYFGHFGADWLFQAGDHSSIQSPPGMGMFHWYMLPLFLLGAGWCVKNFRASPAARVVLAWAILYPVGDCLAWHTGDDGELSLHALRSSPGICGMVLLAAAGAAWTGAWLRRGARSAFWPAVGAMALLAAALNVHYLIRFFGEYNRRSLIYHKYHADLIEACRWLREEGRLDRYDAVVSTTAGFNQPYIVMLHELRYDAKRWLGDRTEIIPGMFDRYCVFGKFAFLYDPAGLSIYGSRQPTLHPHVREFLRDLKENGKPDRVLFLLRPGEERLLGEAEGMGAPILQVPQTAAQPVLLLWEKTM